MAVTCRSKVILASRPDKPQTKRILRSGTSATWSLIDLVLEHCHLLDTVPEHPRHGAGACQPRRNESDSIPLFRPLPPPTEDAESGSSMDALSMTLHKSTLQTTLPIDENVSVVPPRARQSFHTYNLILMKRSPCNKRRRRGSQSIERTPRFGECGSVPEQRS